MASKKEGYGRQPKGYAIGKHSPEPPFLPIKRRLPSEQEQSDRQNYEALVARALNYILEAQQTGTSAVVYVAKLTEVAPVLDQGMDFVRALLDKGIVRYFKDPTSRMGTRLSLLDVIGLRLAYWAYFQDHTQVTPERWKELRSIVDANWPQENKSIVGS